MSIILTGGTGSTSLRAAELLQASGTPFVLASRNAEKTAPSTFARNAAKLDLSDPATFSIPFEHAKKVNGGNGTVKAIYMIMPQTADPVTPMKAFIDAAIDTYGVRRFVMCGGSSTTQGGPSLGQVWQHFVDRGVEHAVLQPTWFIENFKTWHHRTTIRDENKIYTSCGDGKIPFISARDIGAVAASVLAADEVKETGYHVLGPELLTYDQVAEKFSSHLGRNIEHVRVSTDEARERYTKYFGFPPPLAGFLAWVESNTASGFDEKQNDVVKTLTGRDPVSLDQWLEQNIGAFE